MNCYIRKKRKKYRTQFLFDDCNELVRVTFLAGLDRRREETQRARGRRRLKENKNKKKKKKKGRDTDAILASTKDVTCGLSGRWCDVTEIDGRK